MDFSVDDIIMFIIVIFCILSPFTFAADTPRLRGVIPRSYASTSWTPGQYYPAQPVLRSEPEPVPDDGNLTNIYFIFTLLIIYFKL